MDVGCAGYDGCDCEWMNKMADVMDVGCDSSEAHKIDEFWVRTRMEHKGFFESFFEDMIARFKFFFGYDREI